ncbi:hypothetical protein CACET_c18040 [Clostridium aceticum]|uniref:Uncharacterized protein n=1 Tax=Clostridium aceticum TaxID=84022 RepID=A0A0G3WBF2_9CLOT|nr:hypothetical protein [Clostridium aceticum]AKL95252.1 hypothetical protein CACET_c18040 [Clostridium aceticum]
MYTVGQVCKGFGISRSALLYSDSIGLVKSNINGIYYLVSAFFEGFMTIPLMP